MFVDFIHGDSVEEGGWSVGVFGFEFLVVDE
jgi:hypothetical protein